MAVKSYSCLNVAVLESASLVACPEVEVTKLALKTGMWPFILPHAIN